MYPGLTVQWNGLPMRTTLLGDGVYLTVEVPPILIASPGTARITVVDVDGTVYVAGTLTIGTAPTLTGFSPYAIPTGGPAFTLTVSGTGFTAGSVVKWNGLPLATVFLNATQLTATVPANLIANGGTANITVVNPDGSVATRPTPFTIVARPTLTYIYPQSTPAGAGQDFNVCVQGNGFFDTSVTRWNGTPLQTTYRGNELCAIVPANLRATAGAVDITVLNPGGAVSNAVIFTVVGSVSPVISSFLPNTATAGDPGFTMNISGTGFLSTSTVKWNGSPLRTTFVDVSHLNADVPGSLLSAAGTASIIVSNPDGTASSARAFPITPPLSMTSWTPTTVVAGSPSFTLTVKGDGFISPPPPLTVGSIVQWNGSNLSTAYQGRTLLSATVPADLIAKPGTATIRVLNIPGALSTTGTIEIVAPPLSISSAVPASVTAGGAAFTLVVDGSGFYTGATVQWNGSPLTTTFVSATQLTASVPASLIARPGTAAIRVVNPAGVASTTRTIEIVAPQLSISSLAPASITAGGPSFTLVVNGSGFLSGTIVQLNGTSLTTTFVSATQLTAFVPASLIATPGTAAIRIVNPGGAVSTAGTFAIVGPQLSISSLAPASVTAGGPSFTLIVNGSGFYAGATVHWNDSPLATTFAGPTQLTASVPPELIAAPGSASVTVRNPGEVITSPKEFLIGSAGTAEVSITNGGILNAASSRSLIAPGSLISIYGRNLAEETGNAKGTPLPLELNGSAVLINGAAMPLLFVSPTQINAQVPFEVMPGRATVVVRANRNASAPASVEVRATAPGTFTVLPGNHAVAQNSGDWSLNSAQNPARPGDCVIVYLTGQGLVDKPMVTGAAAPTDPLFTPLASIQATIGGEPATVLFAGLTPGLVGLFQINIIVPAVATGEQPLEVTSGDFAANTTAISVRGN